jgi:hypothetical protein
MNRFLTGAKKSRMANPTVGGGKDILKLDRSDGHWSYGQGNEEVQEGSRWFIPVNSLAHGWVRWEAKAKKEVMCYVWEDMPDQPAMIGNKEFEIQNGFEAKCVTGDDAGKEVIYRTNSVGGRRAFDQLLSDVIAQGEANPEYSCAVITFSSSFYIHEEYNKIWNPIFTIVGWADLAGNMLDIVEDPDEDEDDSEEAAPPAKVAKAKKPALEALEPKQTAASHVGQRRRPGA